MLPLLIIFHKKGRVVNYRLQNLSNLWKDAKGHASNRHYKFIRLLDLNQFASFRSSFPRHELAVLLQMPYGRLFSASELEDELLNLYRDEFLISTSSNTEDILKNILQEGSACFYGQVVKLLRLVLTIPITSAEAERSFSRLNRIKTYTRSCMGQARLCDLTVISAEKDIASTVSHQKVIDRFATMKDRRIELHFK